MGNSNSRGKTNKSHSQYVTMREDPFWRSKHSDYGCVMLTEEASGATLKTCMSKLQKGEKDALLFALKELPAFAVNLRPGATAELEAKILEHVGQKINAVKAAAKEDRAVMMAAFFDPVMASIDKIPGATEMKGRLRIMMAQLTVIHLETQREQKLIALAACAKKILDAGARNADAAVWASLHSASTECEGLEPTESVRVVLSEFSNHILDILRGAESPDDIQLTTTQLEYAQEVMAIISEVDSPIDVASYALELSENYGKFLELGTSLDSRIEADSTGERADALARFMKHPRPEAEPSVQKLFDSTMASADKAEDMLLALGKALVSKSETALREAMEKFRPVAGGAPNGGLWKADLPATATLAEVRAVAAESLMKVDGPAVFAQYKDLVQAHDAHFALVKKYQDVIEDDSSATLTECKGLLKLGRVSMSEGVLLEDITNRTSVQSQMKALRKAGASNNDLHPAIFEAMQNTMRSTT